MISDVKNSGDGTVKQHTLKNVKKCARCGFDHENLPMYKFDRPIWVLPRIEFTHWCTCPVSGDPILIETL